MKPGRGEVFVRHICWNSIAWKRLHTSGVILNTGFVLTPVFRFLVLSIICVLQYGAIYIYLYSLIELYLLLS